MRQEENKFETNHIFFCGDMNMTPVMVEDADITGKFNVIKLNDDTFTCDGNKVMILL